MMNEAANQHGLRLGDIDALCDVAENLRRFKRDAPFGAGLSYRPFGDQHAELTKCFTSKWTAAMKRLRRAGQKDNADRLEAARKSILNHTGEIWRHMEEGDRYAWPHAIREKITDLVREIETVVKTPTPGSIEQEQPPGERGIENIVLTDYERRAFEEIAGNPATTTQAYLQKHLPGPRSTSPDPKTVRAVIKVLLERGLICYPYPNAKWKGVALTAAGRALSKRIQSEYDSEQ
jgi:hypothetical protein